MAELPQGLLVADIKEDTGVIDFCRNKADIPAKVAAIEYDPNRTARIALLNYRDGEKRYIVAPAQLNVGDIIVSGEKADIKPGNAVPLKSIPLGSLIHNVELKVGRGGQLIRSAGSLWTADGRRKVMLRSGFLPARCGRCLSNARQRSAKWAILSMRISAIGKAGRARWMGERS